MLNFDPNRWSNSSTCKKNTKSTRLQLQFQSFERFIWIGTKPKQNDKNHESCAILWLWWRCCWIEGMMVALGASLNSCFNFVSDMNMGTGQKLVHHLFYPLSLKAQLSVYWICNWFVCLMLWLVLIRGSVFHIDLRHILLWKNLLKRIKWTQESHFITRPKFFLIR